MSRIQIQGFYPLKGRVSIQGSKNAVLPMMAAALLHRGITVLANVPFIEDVECMKGILKSLGCRCRQKGGVLEIDASFLRTCAIPDSYVKRMRSSVILRGALLGRLGEGSCGYPGGCLIGARPIDLHLQVLESLGAQVSAGCDEVQVRGRGERKAVGGMIRLRYPSVGATEQALLGAVLAEGTTQIFGAAREPEIAQLCRFLKGMGARIEGCGTDCLTICGVKELHDSYFPVEGDRIVAGTYMAAVMAATGQAEIRGVNLPALKLPCRLLMKAGARIEEDETADALRISMKERPRGLVIETAPYPGFPTDLQSPFMAFLAGAKGESRIRETVFEDRFATAGELRKMGARIRVQGREAEIKGVWPLMGTKVQAKDLRGGAALVAAALGAGGETVIENCGYIERGYEDICRDLAALGARIRRI